MPSKRFDQAKPFATLGLLLLAWLILPVAVKTFMRASFFEFTAPITVSTSRVRDLQQYWGLRLHSNHELVKAGQELGNAVASYEYAVQQNAELTAQIGRLESLLKLPSYSNYREERARVARRDFSGWWQRIIIRKGENFGIVKNAPVVFTGGVVGHVTEVHATTSVVEMISSPNVRLSGVIEGDNRPISFQGGVNPTFAPPTGIVESVPLGIVANTLLPKRLVTSGFGGVFPPGLTLGVITRLEPGSEGLFQTGEVKLDERLGTLTEVTVLVPLGAPEAR